MRQHSREASEILRALSVFGHINTGIDMPRQLIVDDLYARHVSVER